MLLGQPIQQIAYFVPDVREAAARHSALFGSGPFFVLENVELGTVTHRGKSSQLDHTAAFGQWGNLQLEFCQQDNPGPSIFHDLYPEGSGRTGLHHVAIYVDDLEKAVNEFVSRDFPEVFRAEVPSISAEAVFVDTCSMYGHFVELFQAAPGILDFREEVRLASLDFNGRNPIRTPSGMPLPS